jgi:hypothetical protein
MLIRSSHVVRKGVDDTEDEDDKGDGRSGYRSKVHSRIVITVAGHLGRRLLLPNARVRPRIGLGLMKRRTTLLKR